MIQKTKYTGMALTKRDLAIQISEKIGLNQQQALQAVQMTLDGICAALKKGQHVEFRDFGVFEVVMRKARIGTQLRFLRTKVSNSNPVSVCAKCL